MFRFIVAASLAVGLGTALPGAAQDIDTVGLQLKGVLEDFQSRYDFPGATAAISFPDGTVATAAVGVADIEKQRVMTPETPMLAASIGKTFVAATVLALESEGRLSQADLLAETLGDRPWFDDLPNAGSMTIGQLLRHTSGLPDHVYQPSF